MQSSRQSNRQRIKKTIQMKRIFIDKTLKRIFIRVPAWIGKLIRILLHR